MAASLRISGRPYMASAPVMSLVLRPLAFRPEKAALTEKSRRIRLAHSQALRTAALGVLSCLDMRPEQAIAGRPRGGRGGRGGE